MKKHVLSIIVLLLGITSIAQVNISTGNNNPDPSAMLEIDSQTKGLLPPRMTTTERNAIVNPATGLVIFNTTTNCIEYFNYGQWFGLCGTCPNPSSPAAGVHVAGQTDITWNWSSIAGVDEYRYNTTNNYATATSNGNSTSYNQTGLSCGGYYTLYVWAVNACGVSTALFLNTNTSACPNPCGITTTVTDIDNNVYATIGIGTQCWMQSNLATTRYRNGDAIPQVTGAGSWASQGANGAWCNYNNSGSNNTTYGKLYNWYAVADSRNVCPTGWHVPSDAEWATIISLLGESVAGGKMKALTLWANPNVGADNSSGFTALPGGYRNENGDDGNLLYSGNWWSSTAYDATNAYYAAMANNTAEIYKPNFFKKVGFSVRCVKD